MALEKIKDPKIIADIAKNDKDSDLREKAIDKLKDQKLLADIAKNDSEDYISRAAVENLKDQELLADVAKTAKVRRVRLWAVEKLEDHKLLADIAKNDSASFVREAAEKTLNFVKSLELSDIGVLNKLLADSAEDYKFDRVIKLLNHGADPNAKDEAGATNTHWIMIRQNTNFKLSYKALALCLEKGGDPYAPPVGGGLSPYNDLLIRIDQSKEDYEINAYKKALRLINQLASPLKRIKNDWANIKDDKEALIKSLIEILGDAIPRKFAYKSDWEDHPEFKAICTIGRQLRKLASTNEAYKKLNEYKYDGATYTSYLERIWGREYI